MRIDNTIAYHGLKRPSEDTDTEIIIARWSGEVHIEFKPNRENGRYTTLILSMEQWDKIVDYVRGS